MSFIIIWVLKFCHNLSCHIEFLIFFLKIRVVTIWVFDFCQNLRFVTFWVLSTCFLSQFEFLSFVIIWVFWDLSQFDVLSFITISVFKLYHHSSFWISSQGFKQTNFPFFCACSCPSYLKSSDYEINMWPRSWHSSVASGPAGWPERKMAEIFYSEKIQRIS